ncbi:MAG TPA: SDR family oxidoreductase [Solirubrobacteraceae bacterium]|nr:SDR family oxidoreductase [Solirubrobacteraceae bacterium]
MDEARVAVITGASSGFGRLTALTVAGRGHQVVATMRETSGRNAVAAESLLAEAAGRDLSLRTLELDVTSDASVDAAIGDVLDEEGRIDVLVNNAGGAVHGMMETITVEQAEAMFATNVFGVVRMNRAVLPHMRARRTGLLLHVSSGLGRVVRPYLGMYCASKFALEAAAEAYRYEVAHLGIDCVIVEPGIFPTDFDAKAAHGADAERASEYGEWTRRMGVLRNERDPQEVADVIADLIDMPTGRRPLRTRVGGPETNFPGQINEVTERVQAAIMERSGLAEHVVLKLDG